MLGPWSWSVLGPWSWSSRTKDQGRTKDQETDETKPKDQGQHGHPRQGTKTRIEAGADHRSRRAAVVEVRSARTARGASRRPRGSRGTHGARRPRDARVPVQQDQGDDRRRLTRRARPFLRRAGRQPSLQERITTRLATRAATCRVFRSESSTSRRPTRRGPRPSFTSTSAADAARSRRRRSRAATHEIKLTVINGSADKPAYALTLDRINLGRCAEVRDSRNRLLRTNHVAFTDAAGAINETVSRAARAHRLQREHGDYRLFDDRSAHGTTIVRNGKTISVPPARAACVCSRATRLCLARRDCASNCELNTRRALAGRSNSYFADVGYVRDRRSLRKPT